MTTPIVTAAEVDLVRKQRDHAEREVHRLRTALNSELLLALTLAARVLDAWQHHTLRSEIRNVAPELAHTLDALQAGPDGVAPQSDLLSDLERRYVESLNAILAAYDDGSADAHRWRGHAEAYRQVCQRLRRDHGMEPAAYTSAEWRRNHGVYTDEDIASFRRAAGHP